MRSSVSEAERLQTYNKDRWWDWWGPVVGPAAQRGHHPITVGMTLREKNKNKNPLLTSNLMYNYYYR